MKPKIIDAGFLENLIDGYNKRRLGRLGTYFFQVIRFIIDALK